MRILLVHPGPDFSVHDVFTGWREGLTEAGVEVASFNFLTIALSSTAKH